MTQRPEPGGAGGARDVDDDRRLQILLEDYVQAREDDRSYAAIQAGALGLALTLLGVLTALVSTTCQFAVSDDCRQAPDWVLALTPLAPLAPIAFLMLGGTIATMRSFYTRALEEEIDLYSGGNLAVLSAVTPMSFARLATTVSSMRRGSRTYRLIALSILLVTLLAFGGLAVFIGYLLPSYRVAMGVGYGAAAVLLVVEVLKASVGGRRYFCDRLREVHTSSLAGMTDRAAERQEERSLTSYLILPRPEDTVKWSILLIAYGVGVWAAGSGGRWAADPWSTGLQLLGVFVLVEYLFYMGRYQVNDARGLADDLESPARSARRRLPHGPDKRTAVRNVAISGLVTVVRAVLALALAVLLDQTRLLLVLLAVLVVYSVGYEALRHHAREAADPAGAQKQSPSEPPMSRRLTVLVRLTWLAVGAGYAGRALAGLWVAGVRDTGILVLATAFFWGLGIVFVLMTWALEATSYCFNDTTAEGKGQPSCSVASHRLLRKPHLLALLDPIGRREGWEVQRVVAAPPEDGANCSDQRVLLRAPLDTPWNLAALATLPPAAGLGGLLLRTGHDWALLFTVLPTAGLVAIWAGFRGSSYQDLKHPLQAMRAKASPVLRPVKAGLMVLFAGRRTLKELDPEQAAPGPSRP